MPFSDRVVFFGLVSRLAAAFGKLTVAVPKKTAVVDLLESHPFSQLRGERNIPEFATTAQHFSQAAAEKSLNRRCNT